MYINLTNSQPQRLLWLPNWRRIWFQILSGALRIGANSAELTTNQGGVNDGIILDPTNANPFIDWWQGELWAVANTAQCFGVVIIPGKDQVKAGIL